MLLQGEFELCSYFAFIIVFRVGSDGEEHCVRSDSGVGTREVSGARQVVLSPAISMMNVVDY